MDALLQTILALAIPWYGGSVIVAAFLPSVPLLGRLGIGWGVGLGGITWLMFGLSLLHIPFTQMNVMLALLACILTLAWTLRRFPIADRRQEETPIRNGTAPRWLRWPMLAASGVILAITAGYNAVWPVTDWDALAAYDLRARAFVRFGSVTIAAQHGNLSYSLWLPPFTSFTHAWIYACAGLDAPVRLLYTTCFAALIAAFIGFVTQYRSERLAYLILPGLPLSPLLGQTFLAYTNLPAAYGFFIATWVTYETLRTSRRRWCLMAGLLWGFAMWTRQSLEPWMGVAFSALCIPWLRQRKFPFYPLVSCSSAIGLNYLWQFYVTFLTHVSLRINFPLMARAWLTILTLPLAITFLTFLAFWIGKRRAPWYLLGTLACLGSLIVSLLFPRYLRMLINPSLMADVFVYLYQNIWPLWEIPLLICLICLIVGARRIGDNIGYVVLTMCYLAIFVVATYLFAVGYPGWQSIPGSAARHSLTIMPVLWACIGIMPGTAAMFESLAILRPLFRRMAAAPAAMSGD